MPACSTFQLCSLISVSEITLSVSVIFSLLLQVKVFVYCLGMSVSFCTCNCYVMRLHICALKVCRGCASCAFKLMCRHCLSFSYIGPSLSFYCFSGHHFLQVKNYFLQLNAFVFVPCNNNYETKPMRRRFRSDCGNTRTNEQVVEKIAERIVTQCLPLHRIE